MAGTVPVITPGSITAMTGLTKRPVYFLSLNGSPTPNLVVKGDAAGADVSIKWGSKLMKNVNDDQVNTKIMTPAEINIFKQFALNAFAADTPQRNNVAGTGAYTWVKMPYVAGLSDAGFLTEDETPKTREIKETVAKFLDTAVWNQLGKIVAVDIFNGNNDRFQVLNGDMSPLGSWNNKGNIMFVTGGANKVIGLDTYDPASDRSNLTTAGHFDELRILIDPGQRNAFATACVKDVGNELKKSFRYADRKVATFAVPPAMPGQLPRTIEVDKLQDLYLSYAPNFSAGLATGAADLKLYLQNKVRQYAPRWQRAMPGGRPLPPVPGPVKTIPKGILDRMAFLGW